MINLTDTMLVLLMIGMLWLIYEVRVVYNLAAPLLSSRLAQAVDRL